MTEARTPPSMVIAALFYARSGFAVFPLRPRTKMPATEHGCLDATTDETQVRAWWSRWPDANIGIAAGEPSRGVWMLDVDGPTGEESLAAIEAEHGPLPTTCEVHTARGRHLYFRVAVGVELPKNTVGRKDKLDTRATGGYVVAPPSVHPDGGLYAWADGRRPGDLDPAIAPTWLVDRFRGKKPSTGVAEPRPAPLPLSTARDVRRKWCLGALEAEARELREAPPGTRNDKINSAAFKIGGYVGAGHLEESEVEHVLLGACSSWAERDERKDIDTLRRGLRAGMAAPRALPSDVEARAYRQVLEEARHGARASLRDAWARVAELRGDERAPGLADAAARLRDLVTSEALDPRDVTARLEDAADRCGLVDATSWTEVREIIGRGLGLAPPTPPITQGAAPPAGGGPRSTHGGDEPPRDPQPIAPSTELRIGEAFARHVDGAAVFVEEEGGWLVYDGKAWQRDRLETIRERCGAFITSLGVAAASRNDRDALKLIQQVSKARGVDAVLRVASSRPEVRRLHEQLDANPDVINCESGTVDLRTGVLRAHDPKDLITRCAPATYEPEADGHADFGALLEHLTPDVEVRSYLQRAIGYSITGRVSEDAIFLLVGASRSGKSTLAHAARGALGGYFASAKMQSFCVQPNAAGGNAARSDLVRLRHGRMVVASEVQPGLQLDNGLLKALAGGEAEAFPFRDMYGKDFVARWIGKVWLICNPDDVPKMRSEDDAFWERARRIPVGRTLSRDERDKGLRERLEQDPKARAAFLLWAVQGAMAWYAQQDLGLPASVQTASEALREEMDPVSIWCTDHLAFEPQARLTKKSLRESYQRSCEDTGEKPVGAKRFAASLRAAGLRVGVAVTDTTARVADKVVSAWAGVRPKTDSELESGDRPPDAGPAPPPPPDHQGGLEW
jgi:putative DNA primase/helicase